MERQVLLLEHSEDSGYCITLSESLSNQNQWFRYYKFYRMGSSDKFKVYLIEKCKHLNFNPNNQDTYDFLQKCENEISLEITREAVISSKRMKTQIKRWKNKL